MTLRERLLKLKTEIQAVYNAASAEKRGLTDEERARLDGMQSELRQVQTELQIEAAERLASAYRTADTSLTRERALRFAEAVTSLRPNQMLTIRAGDATPTATDKVTLTTDVAAMTPLTIGDIIPALSQGLILDRVGCKMQSGLYGDWQYPVMSSIDASIETENAHINDEKMSVTLLKATPFRVALSVKVTNDAFNATNDRLLPYVTEAIVTGCKNILNKLTFSGSAVGGKSGPFVSPGTTDTTATKSVITYKDVMKLRGDVESTGIQPDESAGYVMNSSMAATLRATLRGNGDRMVIEGGAIDGIPVYVTNYAPDDTVYFGFFSYLLVGQFGDMNLIVDPYTPASDNAIRFVINARFDVKAARSEAFGKLTIKTTD